MWGWRRRHRDAPVDRIAVVNGLRGLAIIGVIFQHMGSGWALDALGGELAPLRPLVSNGWTGVNLFFILSGFVLFLPYAAQRRGMASGADVWHFYRARFLRLMPLYYFAAAVVLVLAASVLGAMAFTGLAIDLATMRFAVLPHHFGIAINCPLWSIGVEVLFSLAFPSLVIAAARIGLGRRWPPPCLWRWRRALVGDCGIHVRSARTSSVTISSGAAMSSFSAWRWRGSTRRGASRPGRGTWSCPAWRRFCWPGLGFTSASTAGYRWS